jgi:hypothetical protein
MRQDILRYLIDNYGRLIDDAGRLDRDGALKGIASTILRTFNRELSGMERYLLDRGREEEMEGEPEDLDEYRKQILRQVDWKPRLNSLQEKITMVWTKRGDCRVDIEVAADRLAKAPEATISTIKIKAVLRNYVWTQMEVKPDGRVWRALTPE